MDEATSARVVLELRRAEWSRARALVGGWRAWLDAGLPMDPPLLDDGSGG